MNILIPKDILKQWDATSSKGKTVTVTVDTRIEKTNST